ncbi:MAG: IS66 family insertion sequence element accessory protein TnpB [Phycisphaerales bacterium]|nr:MAG: IS66 family insertion sequence element accessory protein TnpB [Phycisphaerales bacterium]
MLTWPPTVRIFVSTQSTDTRRSFDGLAMITRENMGQDPLSGHLFVFFNRRGDRVKIMFWDRSGFCIWYKRLEQGVFRLPQSIVNAPNLEVEVSDLSLILEGIDLSSARRRKRFTLGASQKKYG